MTDKTLVSPDGLAIRGAPLASARLSRKAALAAVGVLAVLLGFIIINVSKEPPKAAPQESEPAELVPALNAAKSLSMDVPDITPAPKLEEAPVPALPVAPALSAATPAAAQGMSSADLARLAGTEIGEFSKGELTPTSTSLPPHSSAAVLSGGSAPEEEEGPQSAALRAAGGLAGALGSASGAERDLNQQARKAAFLKQARRSGYLESTLARPVSPFELKTGTVIPGVLLSEINSDLPGEIVAQVAQNVYDTASGNRLLIPQGTRLFGHYDSQVAFGQGRLLVSWQRLIYPDASTLELAGMGGFDRGGNAGFGDQVDNHYRRIFGAALLTSVISAGYQISQPQQSSTLTPLSNQQIAAGAVGQQMADLGTQIASRNLRVQPTLRIRKGYRFHVMVNQDIVFPGTDQPGGVTGLNNPFASAPPR